MRMHIWMLPLLAACGRGQPAATPDAPSDAEAPYDVGPTGPINVYVAYPRDTTDRTPIATPGATVIFADAAGHVVDRQVTSGDGVATGMGPADAMVTVLPPTGKAGARFTWVGAQPGEFLYTDEVYTYTPPPTLQTRSVLVPRDGNDVRSYELSMPGFVASNQNPGTSDPIELTGASRVDSLTAPIAIVDASHPTFHHRFIVAHDVTVGPTPLDLTASTWMDPTVVDLPLVNTPADLVWLGGGYELMSGNDSLWYNDDDILVNGPGDTVFHLETPGALGDGTTLQLYFQRGHGASATYWAAAFNGAPSSIDMAALAPPEAMDIVVQPDGTVAWNASGDPARGLAVEMAITTASYQTWNVLLPPDRRTFRLPPLPPDLPAFDAPTRASVVFIGGNDPGGYAAVRTDAEAFRPDNYGKIIPKTPGLYRYSGY